MKKEKLGQESAYPYQTMIYRGGNMLEVNETCYGMSQRMYAAIELRVSDSGEEWLDEMIRKANRRDAACAAMQGLCSNAAVIASGNLDFQKFINSAYMLADELLKQENND